MPRFGEARVQFGFTRRAFLAARRSGKAHDRGCRLVCIYAIGNEHQEANDAARLGIAFPLLDAVSVPLGRRQLLGRRLLDDGRKRHQLAHLHPDFELPGFAVRDGEPWIKLQLRTGVFHEVLGESTPTHITAIRPVRSDHRVLTNLRLGQPHVALRRARVGWKHHPNDAQCCHQTASWDQTLKPRPFAHREPPPHAHGRLTDWAFPRSESIRTNVTSRRRSCPRPLTGHAPSSHVVGHRQSTP